MEKNRRTPIGFLNLGLSVAFLLALTIPLWAAIDNVAVVINSTTYKGGATGAPGTACYNPNNGAFYCAVYGNGAGIRQCYDNQTGFQILNSATLTYFGTSPNPDNGTLIPILVGNVSLFGMALNPCPITVTMTDGPHFYTAGSLAVLINYPGTVKLTNSSGPVQYQCSKNICYYDLRTADQPTTAQPDRANASTGTYYDNSTPPVLVDNITGRYGYTDWNDCLNILATVRDIYNANGAADGQSVTDGRNPVWGSTGKAVYFTSSNVATTGGVYRINTQVTPGTPGFVTRLHANSDQAVEAAVIPTLVRKFNPSTIDGDQIFIRGNSPTNANGISFIVDNGTDITSPQTLLTLATLSNYFEGNGYYNARTAAADGSDTGINPAIAFAAEGYASDGVGNLYFYSSGTTQYSAVWKYDTQNRLYAINNRNQWSMFLTGAPNNDPGNVTPNRIGVRQTTFTKSDNTTMTINQITGTSNSSYINGVSGVKDFGADFNRDGVVDINDYNMLKDNITAHPINHYSYGSGASKKWYDAPQVSVDNATEFGYADSTNYAEYLKCDLNGNGLVTSKDLSLFTQFFGATVSGIVTLSDFSGTVAGTQVTIEVFPSGSSTAADTQMVTLDSTGKFSFSTSQSGSLDIAAKASHWLKKRINGQTLSGMSNTVNLTLINGDADSNNIVNSDDLSIILAVLDTNATGLTDIDGDGEISSTDMAIVLVNLDTTGD